MAHMYKTVANISTIAKCLKFISNAGTFVNQNQPNRKYSMLLIQWDKTIKLQWYIATLEQHYLLLIFLGLPICSYIAT